MKAAFRVDASAQIGTGHLARCLTLADALRAAGAQTEIISRHIPAPMADRVRACGHALAILPPGEALCGGTAHAAWLGTSQDADARATAAALADSGCDWLVVDHYALDATWEKALRPLARRILAIDDLADRPHLCDTLLDQNLQSEQGRYDGLLPAGCRALLGPSYALLRPEFCQAPARESQTRVRRINIFFGGIDAAGMTLRALEEIAPLLAAGIAADVVAGTGNPQLTAITRRCAEVGAQLHVQSGEMAKLFAAADLGLGAGGATSWERCRMGLPSIVICIADNQRSGCGALQAEGAALCLGDAAALAPGAIHRAVKALAADAPGRAAMARHGQARVDGRGTERAMLHMMRETASLRLASPSDAQRAWSWRNHPQTRHFSGESGELAWDSHHAWWQASLQATQRDLLVASCAGIDFGILRFDREGDDALVSIYLDPGLGGLGLGSAALRAGNAWIVRHRAAKRLTARILGNNEQSQRSFAAAGYSQVGPESWARSVHADTEAAQ